MLCVWKASNCQVTISIFKLVFYAACICIAHPYDCVKPFAFFFGSNFIFLCFGMVMYDNKFKTKQNKIGTKDNMEPQLEQ